MQVVYTQGSRSFPAAERAIPVAVLLFEHLFLPVIEQVASRLQGERRRGLRMACNQALCEADEPLSDGDEVAFFPPVTGG